MAAGAGLPPGNRGFCASSKPATDRSRGSIETAHRDAMQRVPGREPRPAPGYAATRRDGRVPRMRVGLSIDPPLAAIPALLRRGGRRRLSRRCCATRAASATTACPTPPTAPRWSRAWPAGALGRGARLAPRQPGEPRGPHPQLLGLEPPGRSQGRGGGRARRGVLSRRLRQGPSERGGGAGARHPQARRADREDARGPAAPPRELVRGQRAGADRSRAGAPRPRRCRATRAARPLIDTCHLHAAGFDLSGDEARRAARRRARRRGRARSRGRLSPNDCLLPCGAHRDRHAAPGTGTIGMGVVSVATHSAFAALPGVLELALADARPGSPSCASTTPSTPKETLMTCCGHALTWTRREWMLSTLLTTASAMVAGCAGTRRSAGQRGGGVALSGGGQAAPRPRLDRRSHARGPERHHLADRAPSDDLARSMRAGASRSSASPTCRTGRSSAATRATCSAAARARARLPLPASSGTPRLARRALRQARDPPRRSPSAD